MFIRFNYRCSSCGNEEERFIKKIHMDHQSCTQCMSWLTRLPAAPRTTFRHADRKLKP